MRRFRIAAFLAVATITSLGAQTPAAAKKPIQDNSFLLEEAYNQEAGVVQHINTVLFDRTVHAWLYALTDEWPLNGQRHQLSVTIPLQNSSAGNTAALGDIALNYRLQLVGSGDTRLAVTPRLTVLFPTAADELGGGTLGVQGALASSYVATPELVLHTNAGVTVEPNAENGLGGSSRLVDLSAGQSVIWLVHRRLNLMLEGTITSLQSFTGVGTNRTRSTGITIAPGLRWAHDFASGLQIVPGLAFPIGFRANEGQRGVFLYLSFEHDMPGLRK
jgi:hypothetical protein